MSSSAPVDETLHLGAHTVRLQVRGDGPPLLLLNGIGAPLELWQPLVHQLGGARTIAFDAPGSGDSGVPGLPLSIGGHARLAVQVLDALSCPSASVLGFSFGGLVAQELAIRSGSRVEKLVLASTSCGWGGVPGSPAALLEIARPDRYYSRAFFREAARSYVGGTESADEAFLAEQGRLREMHPPNRRGYFYQWWAAASWSSLPWLSRVRAPSLIITGSADPLVPPVNANLLAALLPDARLHVVSGGGHLCLLERAEEVAPVIEGFLA